MSIPLAAKLRSYYEVTKPGIIRGNALAVLAGFLLAAKGEVNPWLLLATLGGLSLVIASACVYNNYIDRAIDARMARTKKRALVSGEISARSALVYATVLGLAGGGILAAYTTTQAFAWALIGFVFYVGLYSLWWKRSSVHGTEVGSVSGAVPPVVGYTAVTGQFDAAALLLFLALVFWQMPHFYAIALFRLKDYKAAGIPVLPAQKGAGSTKKHIVIYIVLFWLAASLLVPLGYAGYSYLVLVSVVSLLWLRQAMQGFSASDTTMWARRQFRMSLVVLLAFCVALAGESFLP